MALDDLTEVASALGLASEAIDETFHTVADAIEEDPDKVAEILRKDVPIADRVDELYDLVQDDE